jgi:hypothetical protein
LQSELTFPRQPQGQASAQQPRLRDQRFRRHPRHIFCVTMIAV